MVVLSNFLVVYFGLNYSSLFCVILVSSRRRIYILVEMYVESLKYGIKELKSYHIYPCHLIL